jgi:hypothetical protein
LTKIYNLELQFNRSFQIFTFSAPNFKSVFLDLVPILSLRQKPKKKFKKVSVLDLVPVLRVQKQPKKTFQKTVKMYLVPATNLKNKKKF